MGSEEEKRQVEKGLVAASGFIRKGLGERLALRYTPELIFQRDESIERGSRLLQLINEVAAEDSTDKVDKT
jgi:ribosome-binding factor A